MQKRILGKTYEELSVLGLGCMRLPTKDANPYSKEIEDEQVIKMIRYAIDNGINYLDTAYVYHQGRSESVVGKALKKGYRNKVKISSKSPIFIMKNENDFDRYLDEQLKRLATDHLDFYLLHNLNHYYWDNVVLKFNLLDKLEKAKKDGKILHIGFSFHDKLAVFKQIVDYYENWEFCLLQLNYLNETEQAGLEGVRYARDKNLGVMAMEPLLGGKLANPADKVKQLIGDFEIKKSPSQWAFEYLWNKEDISTTLSGMHSLEQIKENIAYAQNASENMFSEKENAIIKLLQETFSEISDIPCTNCCYCMPCPSGVDIPKVFSIYNELFMYNLPQSTKASYLNLRIENKKSVAENCSSCKVCESKCPQNIKISSMMKIIEKEFS